MLLATYLKERAIGPKRDAVIAVPETVFLQDPDSRLPSPGIGGYRELWGGSLVISDIANVKATATDIQTPESANVVVDYE